MRVLLLGGTGEAGQMAAALAARGIDAVYSYAGRTGAPLAQPLPLRVGGFGGVAGLSAYLAAERISHVVDATHPFASQMSCHAVLACRAAQIPLIGFERPPWAPAPGDRWRHVPDIPAAAAALQGPAERVFLAIGRQHLAAFTGQPQHHYLLRLVDPPEAPLPLPQAEVVLARGPFDPASDTALMRRHGTTLLVAKNAGGSGAAAKLAAARALALPVLMIARPQIPEREVAQDVAGVLGWLAHTARLGA